MKNKTALDWTCFFQGLFYFITGVWPLLHIESFIWISGPKYDIWLVKTVGILLVVVGIVLFSAGLNKRINEEIFLLAVGCAAGLTVVDIYYATIDRIWDVYLLDAVAESILVVLWFIFYIRKERYTANR